VNDDMIVKRLVELALSSCIPSAMKEVAEAAGMVGVSNSFRVDITFGITWHGGEFEL